MTLLEEFSLRYPEFSTPPPGQLPATGQQVEYWIAQAELFLCPSRWGATYRPAVLAWAATHLAASLRQALNGPVTGESGPVASASVGGESVSYSTGQRYGRRSAAEDWMLLYPPYGPEYLALRDSTLSGVESTRTFAPFESSPCNG
jgi:hypothetical protein